VERLPVPRPRTRSTSPRPRLDGFEDFKRRNSLPSGVATNSTSVFGKRPNRSLNSCGIVTCPFDVILTLGIALTGNEFTRQFYPNNPPNCIDAPKPDPRANLLGLVNSYVHCQELLTDPNGTKIRHI
jgi:hypothetical protein